MSRARSGRRIRRLALVPVVWLVVLLGACAEDESQLGRVDGAVPLDAEPPADLGRRDGRPRPDRGRPDRGEEPRVDEGPGLEDRGPDQAEAADRGSAPDLAVDQAVDLAVDQAVEPLDEGPAPADQGADGAAPDQDPGVACGQGLPPCPPLDDGRPQRCDEIQGLCVEDEPPVAEGGRLRMDQDTALALTLGGSDPAGQPLTFEIVTPPAHGLLDEGAGPARTYRPAAGFVGVDRFEFRVRDVAGQPSRVAEIVIEVARVNQRPRILGQARLEMAEDSTLRLGLELLELEDDGPLESLVLSLEPGPGYTAEGLDLTPALDFFGPLVAWVVVRDEEGGVSDPYPLAVEVLPVNDPPVIRAAGARLEAREDTPFAVPLAALVVEDPDNSVDEEGFTVEVQPGAGYAVGPAGEVIPEADRAGPLVVWVVVRDPEGAASEAFGLEVWLAPVNDPPQVVGLVLEGVVGHAPLVGPAGALLAGAVDVDGDPLAVQPVEAAPTLLGGRVWLAADGGFRYEGPLGLAEGEDRFAFTVADGQGGLAVGEVRLGLRHRVWFLEAGAEGVGRLDDPRGDLEETLLGAQDGDVLYLSAAGGPFELFSGVVLPEGVRLVGAVSGLRLGLNLDLAPGARPTLHSPQGELLGLSPRTEVRGLRLTGAARALSGFNLREVLLADLWFEVPGELAGFDSPEGRITAVGWRSRLPEGPDEAFGGGITVFGGAGPLVLEDLDLHTAGTCLQLNSLAAVEGRGLRLQAERGAVLDAFAVPALDLALARASGRGGFGASLRVSDSAGTLTVAEAVILEAFEGGLLVQGPGALTVQVDSLEVRGGSHALRLEAPEAVVVVGRPGDEAALSARDLEAAAVWLRDGQLTVHGLSVEASAGAGIALAEGADVAGLTVHRARFEGIAGPGLRLGPAQGPAQGPSRLRAARLTAWEHVDPQAPTLALEGFADTSLEVEGLRAGPFPAGQAAIEGRGQGVLNLTGLDLHGISAADGIVLAAEGASQIRLVGGAVQALAGDAGIWLSGAGEAPRDLYLEGLTLSGFAGDQVRVALAGAGAASVQVRGARLTGAGPPTLGAGVRLALGSGPAWARLADNEITTGGGPGVALATGGEARADLVLLDNRLLGGGISLEALGPGTRLRAALQRNEVVAVGPGLVVAVPSEGAVAVEGEGADLAEALQALGNALGPIIAAQVGLLPLGTLVP